jgi:hypothetical protein
LFISSLVAVAYHHQDLKCLCESVGANMIDIENVSKVRLDAQPRPLLVDAY